MFTKNLITQNGRTFCEGNARLNEYLHLAQNVFIVKTGEKLFFDDLYACPNGVVVVDVQENYSILWNRKIVSNLAPKIIEFLDKLCLILKNAPLDELIRISHEDSAWADKYHGYSTEQQRMDSLAYIYEYRSQYADVLEIMERIGV